ncbi:hypothetical protein SCP_1801240 [Sparassis crispa]|uniref:Protein F37C4.5 n=1 Tax=Sparassis crispa TaxID=139825 RepID=A0A401H6V5_9APHY|nr:hypothetical protein SCP_1801240 [Sparassis crispa]GBE90100.1 hypothetical protein SCP_1801240 [Sparassis crispa]
MTSIKVNVSQHPVKSVTVFQSSTAEVGRIFSLDLTAGQNTVEITGLPSCIDTESVRVTGLGSGARLFDVVSTIKKSASFGDADASDSIRELKRKKKSLEDERRVLLSEARFLSSYSQTLSSQYVSPDDALEFLDTFSTREKDGVQNISDLTERILDLDTLIWEEMGKKQGEACGHVAVVIVAKSDCTVELKLMYLVTGASWEPCYDLYATTVNGQPAPSVSLHYRARIIQSTGEHWTNSSLTLSTSSSQALRNASIPDIKLLKLRKRSPFMSVPQIQVTVRIIPVSKLLQNVEPENQQTQQPSTTTFGPPGVGAAARGVASMTDHSIRSRGRASYANPTEDAVNPQPAAAALGGGIAAGQAIPAALDQNGEFTFVEAGESEAERVASQDGPITEGSAAVVRSSPLATAYRVEGSATIPSDGLAHKVFVAALDFSVEMSHVCVPRVRAAVFIETKIKNTSEYNLLPGPVSVLLDDSYVSKFALQSTGTNDSFTCTLGVDTSLRVTYERSRKTIKEEQRAFADTTKKTTVTVRAKVENRHTSDIPTLVVREAIPTTEDEQFKVVLKQPEGLATAKEGEEVAVTDAGDSKKILPGWKVRWSKAMDGKGGESEGKFEWFGGLAAGKTTTLAAEWEVRVPVGVVWDEVVQHVAGSTT